jgi:hypothetical protein
MLRRRCNPLTRIMLTAAFGCCELEELSRVRTVFASRHGSINDSIGLLEALALGKPISPTIFSHTVHNVQAGLFSLAAENRMASSSVSAQQDTFACAYVEALTHLDRQPERSVLLVVGDVPLVTVFASLVDEPAVPYALALLLSSNGTGTRVELQRAPAEAERARTAWPDSLEFLRWLVSREAELSIGSGRSRYRWVRG